MTIVEDDVDLDAPAIECDDYYREDDDAPRRDVVAPFELRAAAADGDGLTLVGYAAVFNSPTRISGMDGDFVETIAPGAFRHTIRNSRPVMQFDHGTHPLIGSMPISTIRKLREDDHGLYVEARVFNNWLTEPLRDAIREQAINGMSFRFSVVKDTWTKKRGGDSLRTLNEVKLYELGPVVHPAYADTTVALRSLERATGFTILGSSDAPATPGSADEPAIAADPAGSQSTRTKNQRRAIALLASERNHP